MKLDIRIMHIVTLYVLYFGLTCTYVKPMGLLKLVVYSGFLWEVFKFTVTFSSKNIFMLITFRFSVLGMDITN